MKLTIEIETDNAAFGSPDNSEYDNLPILADQLRSIFARIAEQVYAGECDMSVRDSNGNKVGSWVLR